MIERPIVPARVPLLVWTALALTLAASAWASAPAGRSTTPHLLGPAEGVVASELGLRFAWTRSGSAQRALRFEPVRRSRRNQIPRGTRIAWSQGQAVSGFGYLGCSSRASSLCTGGWQADRPSAYGSSSARPDPGSSKVLEPPHATPSSSAPIASHAGS